MPEGHEEGSSGNEGSNRPLGAPGERDLDLKDFGLKVTAVGNLGLATVDCSMGARGECPFKGGIDSWMASGPSTFGGVAGLAWDFLEWIFFAVEFFGGELELIHQK
jgi:hypothetical protein